MERDIAIDTLNVCQLKNELLKRGVQCKGRKNILNKKLKDVVGSQYLTKSNNINVGGGSDRDTLNESDLLNKTVVSMSEHVERRLKGKQIFRLINRINSLEETLSIMSKQVVKLMKKQKVLLAKTCNCESSKKNGSS